MFFQDAPRVIRQGSGNGCGSLSMDGSGIVRRGSERYSMMLLLYIKFSPVVPRIIRQVRVRGFRRGSDTDPRIICRGGGR